eukprot:m.122461 g.122461  ORF g.122461 m.122461 type:complete len:738 (-) comp13733_c0_seq1:1156-3369(-)
MDKDTGEAAEQLASISLEDEVTPGVMDAAEVSPVSKVVAKTSPELPGYVLLTLDVSDASSARDVTKHPNSVLEIIDVSGSMMGSALNAVKESILAEDTQLHAAWVANPDACACITFNYQARRISFDMRPQIRAGGGTSFRAAFEVACTAIEDNPHIERGSVLFITDGQGETANLDPFIRLCVQRSLMVHVIGIGQGYDRHVLATLVSQLDAQGVPVSVDETHSADEIKAVLNKCASLVGKAFNPKVEVTFGTATGNSVTQTLPSGHTKELIKVCEENVIQLLLLGCEVPITSMSPEETDDYKFAIRIKEGMASLSGDEVTQFLFQERASLLGRRSTLGRDRYKRQLGILLDAEKNANVTRVEALGQVNAAQDAMAALLGRFSVDRMVQSAAGRRAAKKLQDRLDGTQDTFDSIMEKIEADVANLSLSALEDLSEQTDSRQCVLSLVDMKEAVESSDVLCVCLQITSSDKSVLDGTVHVRKVLPQFISFEAYNTMRKTALFENPEQFKTIHHLRHTNGIAEFNAVFPLFGNVQAFQAVGEPIMRMCLSDMCTNTLEATSAVQVQLMPFILLTHMAANVADGGQSDLYRMVSDQVRQVCGYLLENKKVKAYATLPLEKPLSREDYPSVAAIVGQRLAKGDTPQQGLMFEELRRTMRLPGTDRADEQRHAIVANLFTPSRQVLEEEATAVFAASLLQAESDAAKKEHPAAAAAAAMTTGIPVISPEVNAANCSCKRLTSA